MATINELYKDDEDFQNNLRNIMRGIFSSEDNKRSDIVKELNSTLGLSGENSFKAFDELVDEYKNLENQEEKDKFIKERVNSFLTRFGDNEVDADKLVESLTNINNSFRSQPNQSENIQPNRTQTENEPVRNESEWKSNFERQVDALKRNRPDVYDTLRGLPENKREQYLNNLLRSGYLSQEDVSAHQPFAEKPVQRQPEERPDNTDPNNFVNPKKSHSLNIARAIEERAKTKRYEAELAAQQSRMNIRNGNIRRIERGTSECVTDYSDARIVQSQNIADFDKECERNIAGFSGMSDSEKKAAVERKVAEDPAFKEVHERVVRGYDKLKKYDERMLRYLEDAKNNGVDVTRNAEEYDQLKERKIEPAKVETDEIKEKRTIFERMAERIKEAVVGLMNRFGFGKKPSSPEATASSSSFSGPSNG